MRRLFCLLAVTAMLLLGSSWGGLGAQEATRISPPPQYHVWFDEVAACVGAEKTFHKLTFYTIEGAGWYDEVGDFILGSYYWATDRIFLAKTLMYSESLVKHEMMHYLIDPYGDHPMPPYGQCEYENIPFTPA